MARKHRTILVVSKDRGRSWQYYNTVTGNTEIVKEGLSGLSFARLPNGDLFAAIRTGMFGRTDPHGRADRDEPLMASWARCDGRMWSLPTCIYKEDTLIVGIYPAAEVTAGAVLALMRTRPNGRYSSAPTTPAPSGPKKWPSASRSGGPWRSCNSSSRTPCWSFTGTTRGAAPNRSPPFP